MTIISLEGNIGSGKEAVIQVIKRYFVDSVLLFEDSVCNWKDHGLLRSFNKDPKRWALTLETYSVTQKCKRFMKRIPSNAVVITRRSPMSNKECFVRTNVQMGHMTMDEKRVYDTVVSAQPIPQYQSVIYLKSVPDKCIENTLSKKGVSGTSFDYIRNLHANYEDWISQLKQRKVDVIEIDMDVFSNLEGSDRVQDMLVDLLLARIPLLKNYLKPGAF